MATRPFPEAQLHGELIELFPDVFFVSGSVKMAPLPVRFSRNMTVVREGDSLVLINSMRLTDEGLAALDKLGKVTDVIRLAGFHGMDDPFYKDRYGATVSVVAGMKYMAGFDASKSKDGPYFEPDVQLTADSELPIADASLYVFPVEPPEGILVLDREGGIAITGDCLQNWSQTNGYFNWVGKGMMRMMGFIKAHNVGPGWIKATRPTEADLRGVLDLKFDHLLPAHGDAVIGDAKAKYRPVIEAYSAG